MTPSPSSPTGNEAVDAWASRGKLLDTPDGRVFHMAVDAAAGANPDATPVLVCHGFPSASFDFRHVLDELTADRPVILFDYLGFGLSDKADRHYGIRLQADAAERVAAAHGIERCLLLTHDMGDSVGGELLRADLDSELPFEVIGRVLTNGSIYLDLAQLTFGQQMLSAMPDERIRPATGFGGDLGASFGAGLAGTFSAANPAGEDELAAQWALMSRLDGHLLLARLIRYLEDRRVEESRFTGAIERHPSPLAVLWGVDDPVAVVAMVGRLIDAVEAVGSPPPVAVERLDDVGHYPMIERPDLVGPLLRQMLASVDLAD